MRAFIWPALYSRLDLIYSVGVLSRYCNALDHTNVDLVKYVLQYVSETFKLGLSFNLKAVIYHNVIRNTDRDFAGSKTDWKSTGGYVSMFEGAAISYSTKLQLIITLSTCEEEYFAKYEAKKEAVQLSWDF